MTDYRKINFAVMTDTRECCKKNPELKKMIQESIHNQFMVSHDENIDQQLGGSSQTEYVVTGDRTYHAAKPCAASGKRVAVLNFANNHSIGGAPYAAGAQEESLCRASTLLPCLEAMRSRFYDRHIEMYHRGKLDYMGNDDLIYTPGVCVFKTDELTDPISPKMLPRDEWYCVDVITSAAPELWHGNKMPDDYREQISSRIKKILDVAKMQGVEVLILGAWGCGAFKNPADVVASVFHEHLQKYDFQKVIFAMGRTDVSNTVFFKEFTSSEVNAEERIKSLLRSTGRENIEKVIDWMNRNDFFVAPASVVHHNNFRGGLAKHSLEVYEEAIRLNSVAKLPISSVTLCALLHDVCKSDQYSVDELGSPASVRENIKKGHGRRSMFILKRGCALPLNYDEEMAIWWHMGEHEQSKDYFPDLFNDSMNIPLCALIQQADSNAACGVVGDR